MALPLSDDPNPETSAAMALAANPAQEYARKGDSANDLFSAFVGVVVERDRRVGLDCLTALDRWLSRASAGNASPSA
jgi:hypothetical protein